MAQEKSFVLPVTDQCGGMVIDQQKNGSYNTVKSGEKSGMEWCVGNYFTGPSVIVMEFAIPKELQGKLLTVSQAMLRLCTNGSHGTYPDDKPELAPDIAVWIYTDQQANGKITSGDVRNVKDEPVGKQVALLIESQTPVKAGTKIQCDLKDAIQKVLDDKAQWVGIRLESKALPKQIAVWRWRSPLFGAKYGKAYTPTLTIKVQPQ